MFDTIIKSYIQTFIEQDTSEYRDAMVVLYELVVGGDYTKRKHAAFYLKNWTTKTNKELAQELGSTVQTVYSAKNLIESDFEDNVCAEEDIVRYINDKDTKNIYRVVELYHVNSKMKRSVVPDVVLSVIDNSFKTDLEMHALNSVLEAVDESEVISNGLIDLTTYLESGKHPDEATAAGWEEALDFIKPILNTHLEQATQLQDTFLLGLIVGVLSGKYGTVALRNKLIESLSSEV